MNKINGDILIMNLSNTIHKSKSVCQLCKICGAPALFINFGVISCSSCKMFFKRNAECRKGYFTCDFSNNCEINIYNRRRCSSCRLTKCFTCGMQIELIRNSRTRKNKKRQIKPIILDTLINRNMMINQPVQLPTLSLLRSDQSTLTANQWNLLSNLIHCYDEYSGFLIAQNFISEQNALPYKLRYKIGPVSKFITFNMSRVQRIFEKNDDYLSLCLQDRSTLLRHTIKHTGCLGATFVLHHANLLNNPSFYKSNEIIFGSEVMSTITPLTRSYDIDATFVKLILTIIAFSTTSYTTYTNTPPINLIDIKTIVHIQDTYIDIAWRYMVYKYSYEQAVKRFCQLIRCFFNTNFTIVEVDRIQEYTNIINTVIEETEQILAIKN